MPARRGNRKGDGRGSRCCDGRHSRCCEGSSAARSRGVTCEMASSRLRLRVLHAAVSSGWRAASIIAVMLQACALLYGTLHASGQAEEACWWA
jgi:hypothetical protein